MFHARSGRSHLLLPLDVQGWPRDRASLRTLGVIPDTPSVRRPGARSEHADSTADGQSEWYFSAAVKIWLATKS